MGVELVSRGPNGECSGMSEVDREVRVDYMRTTKEQRDAN